MALTLAQEAKELLKDIPEDKWTTGTLFANDEKCCMMGHWDRIHYPEVSLKYFKDPDNITSEEYDLLWRNKLANYIEDFLIKEKKLGHHVRFYYINDNDISFNIYKSDSIKERNMMLFDDMIKHGW